MHSQPPLLVTMGDPSGIGPEIVIKALAALKERNCVALGHAGTLSAAAKAHAPGVPVAVLRDLAEATGAPDRIEILDTGGAGPFPTGTVSAASGQAAVAAIHKGIDLALAGASGGIVTAPIHKEAISAAGVPYPGHTELLAARCGGAQVAMMLANEDLRTVLVTIHCSLREAIARADHAAQMAAIRLAHQGCRALGIAEPRVAVAGLNPHAGEGGLFGREEIEIIAPAIADARAVGIDATGPWPGDTVFMRARKGEFDVVVAQYHDQGLIPVKYLGVEDGVNITLGLPFVRTSPDHGTAFDIAGKGVADASSMVTAIRCAERLATVRHHAEEAV